ncbi:hypothetical protein Baya_5384 [Bagarius yarrelli]|uniref:Uncharacterized protein n=1 Tax=Bagarius yarrelli TaxID=175774 RepID=A0A556TWL8_BAGYA|nr:hypothetical protein Baya_5384 [Bagarius yarrelli]
MRPETRPSSRQEVKDESCASSVGTADIRVKTEVINFSKYQVSTEKQQLTDRSGNYLHDKSEKPTRVNFCLKRVGNIFSIFMISFQSPSTSTGQKPDPQTVRDTRR